MEELKNLISRNEQWDGHPVRQDARETPKELDD